MLLNKCSSKLWWEYLKRNIQKVQTFNSKSKKYPAGTLSISHVFYLGDFCFCVRQALNHMDVCAYQQLSNMRNTSEWSLDGQLGMGCVWPQACSMKSSFPSCKSDPDQLQGGSVSHLKLLYPCHLYLIMMMMHGLPFYSKSSQEWGIIRRNDYYIHITYNTKIHLKLNNNIRLSKLNLNILCIFNHSVCHTNTHA